jgi:formylglycine-generating enzyme required for sulfatase activity
MLVANRSWIPLLALLLSVPLAAQQPADPAQAALEQGDAYSSQAVKLYEARSYTQGNEAKTKGIAAYRRAIELNPRLFEAHRNLGDLYRRNTTDAGNFERAADAYKKALEIKTDAETASRLGISYTALGRAADAVPAFEQAARLAPGVGVYQYNLGFAYAELANFPAARKIQAQLRSVDTAYARRLEEKIGQLSGEASLTGRPTRYSNPRIELVSIPAGSFVLGGNTTASGTVLEGGRKVTIRNGFYMGKYPVTQAQWQAVMGDNPSFFTSCGGNCPVEQVTWHDAQAFVTRLNLLKDGYRYRLPSEVEWEYAYRGGTTTATYALGDIGWNSRNSGSKTHPVGEKPANPFGLFDMGGHVKEWCQDTAGKEPFVRVLRGTTFYAMPESGGVARSKGRVDEVSRNHGFRVVAEKS